MYKKIEEAKCFREKIFSNQSRYLKNAVSLSAFKKKFQTNHPQCNKITVEDQINSVPSSKFGIKKQQIFLFQAEQI